jgi:hypothetical protein
MANFFLSFNSVFRVELKNNYSLLFTFQTSMIQMECLPRNPLLPGHPRGHPSMTSHNFKELFDPNPKHFLYIYLELLSQNLFKKCDVIGRLSLTVFKIIYVKKINLKSLKCDFYEKGLLPQAKKEKRNMSITKKNVYSHFCL